MRSLLLALLSVYFVASFVSAQTKSLNDFANYRGADREEVLKAGAKKEGKMVWYTSLTAHRDIANVFEAKYPGVRVETYRAGPNDLTRRLITEAQSKRNIADLIETTPSTERAKSKDTTDWICPDHACSSSRWIPVTNQVGWSRRNLPVAGPPIGPRPTTSVCPPETGAGPRSGSSRCRA